MAEFAPMQETNPLKKYFRQPKIYTGLPSKGKFYPPGTLNMPETGELAVYPMTAKDDLAIKTPDALLNGQATVDVIKSCVPEIIDPWYMPSVDVDAILIAIRMATYGESLDLDIKVPGTGEEKTYTVDLRTIMNKLVTASYNDKIEVGNMIINLKPLTYKEFTQTSLKTFEEQRVFALVNDQQIPDEEKLFKFNESFRKLTDMTVNMLSKSIASIVVDGEIVDNPAHIQEFVDNADKDLFRSVLDHLESEKSKFQIEPMKIKTSPEEQEKGAPETFEVPITFDQSNFFA